ncbi:MAG: AraC family transcriptional regulator [Rubrivivax sp.]
MATAPCPHGAPARRPSERFMWLTPDRVLYVGLLGAPTVRTMGSVNVYVSQQGLVRVRLEGGDWHEGEMAVVPPHLPHQVLAEARHIDVLQIEAETVDLAALPAPLRGCGIVDDRAFVERVRAVQRRMAAADGGPDLATMVFDHEFFGGALPARRLDARIQSVVDAIKRDPAAPMAAEDCAQSVQLSFSRFLHLFKQEVGAPFRSFRTWKRARSLLHYVNRDANLAHVAQDTGYPDSTHFSHSIRAVYGLKPKDIFAGSRRLAIYAQFS